MARAPEGDERQCDFVKDDGSRCGAYRMVGQKYCVGHARTLGLVQIEVPERVQPPSGDAAGSGLNAGLDERDRALALKEARRMLKDATTPAAVKAQLVNTLTRLDEQGPTGAPPAVEALHSCTTEELEALLA